MAFKVGDKVVSKLSGREFTIHETIYDANHGRHVVIIGENRAPVVFDGEFIDRNFRLKSDVQPGDFYVSDGGSVFMVDQKSRIWLISDQYDGKHKTGVASHQGYYSSSLDHWESTMEFGLLMKIRIKDHKVTINVSM